MLRPQKNFFTPLSRKAFVRLRTFALVAVVLSLLAVPARAVELTDVDDVNDFIILYSLGYYATMLPQAGMFVFEDANFAGMQVGERVWIVAHGKVGMTGHKNAPELLVLFTAKGLPKTTPTVYLFSCESGLTDATHPQSLVTRLAELMRAAGWNEVHTEGTYGCSITDRTLGTRNSERVVVEGKEDEVYKIQLELEEALAPQAQLDAWIAQFEVDHGRRPTLAEKARFAYAESPAIRGFFAGLIAMANDQGLLRPPGQGFATAP